MRTIFSLLFNFGFMVLCHTNNHLSIQLLTGVRLFKSLKGNSTFPDVEKVFQVDGRHVTSLSIEGVSFPDINSRYLEKLVNLKTLEIIHNMDLKNIEANTFVWNKKLTSLTLSENAIVNVSPRALTGLFKSPSTRGALHMDGNDIKLLPRFQGRFPGLKELYIDGNPIEEFLPGQFSGMPLLSSLSVRRTGIKRIDGNLFTGNPSLHSVKLSENELLEYIDDSAFVGTNLRTLDISGTGISRLPSKGLESLRELKISSIPKLFDIPDGIISIATLKTVMVGENQRYLCCAFEMKRARLQTIFKQRRIDDISKLCPSSTGNIGNPVSATKMPPVDTTEETLHGFGFGKKRRRRSFIGSSQDGKVDNNTKTPPINDDFFPSDGSIRPVNRLAKHSKGSVICVNHSDKVYVDAFVNVNCTPRPDALRPCDNIMGDVGLTVLSWLVALVGLFANAFVFTIITLSRRTLSVTRFLLQNLSFADLCLSLYLFLLVCASAHTHGSYYNYVRKWQYGGGCTVLGFLAIFSSQLSVLVLFVITVERYFSIVHAMRFNLRFTLPKAKVGVVLSWLIAFTMAILPVAGVNSYNEVAICLPFRTSETRDLVYLGVLLTVNVVLFLVVSLAYLRMYQSIRRRHLHQPDGRTDSEVAKRMALLVFTDFFCWMPIAFVALVSAFAGPDVLDMDVKKSKYLLVIFFPINAICNPILYATTTSAFKKDAHQILLHKCLKANNETLLCKHEDAETRSRRLTSLSSLLNKAKQKSRDVTPVVMRRRCSEEGKESAMLLTPMIQERSISLRDFAKVLEQTRHSESFSPSEQARHCSESFSPSEYCIVRDTLNVPKKRRATQNERMRRSNTHNPAHNKKMPFIRVRSNSEGRIDKGIITPAFKQITFKYDLSRESFLNAKETTGL